LVGWICCGQNKVGNGAMQKEVSKDQCIYYCKDGTKSVKTHLYQDSVHK
jgi:hypothetical protein